MIYVTLGFTYLNIVKRIYKKTDPTMLFRKSRLGAYPTFNQGVCFEFHTINPQLIFHELESSRFFFRMSMFV